MKVGTIRKIIAGALSVGMIAGSCLSVYAENVTDLNNEITECSDVDVDITEKDDLIEEVIESEASVENSVDIEVAEESETSVLEENTDGSEGSKVEADTVEYETSDSEVVGISTVGTFGSRLSGNDLIVYNFLVDEIVRIANNRTSEDNPTLMTDINIPVSYFIGTKWQYTAAELHLPYVQYDGELHPDLETAVNSLFEFDKEKVIEAIFRDWPFEIYWYGGEYSVSYPAYAVTEYDKANINNQKVYFTETESFLSVEFIVSIDYRYLTGGAEKYISVNPNFIRHATTAKGVADNVVRAYNSNSNVNLKLMNYVSDVCNRTAPLTGSGYYYGDWSQMISVYDKEDDETDTFPEGYARAFQYLFNSSDMGGMECFIVSGKIGVSNKADNITASTNHTWNIIKTPDGRYWTLDLYNIDKYNVPTAKSIYMGTAINGSINNGFVYQINDNLYIKYSYDSVTKALCTATELSVVYEINEKPEDDKECEIGDHKDPDKDCYCDICKKVVDKCQAYGYSVLLDTNIGVVCTMALNQDILDDSGAYISFSNGTETSIQYVKNAAVVENSNGHTYFNFTLKMNPKDVYTKIQVKVVSEEKTLGTFEFSLKEYINKLLNDNKYLNAYHDSYVDSKNVFEPTSEDAVIYNMVNALDKYCDNVSKYFTGMPNTNYYGYASTDYYTVKAIYDKELTNTSVSSKRDNGYVISNDNSGFEFFGASMILESEPTLRMYFTVDTEKINVNLLSNYKVNVKNNSTNTSKNYTWNRVSDGFYYIDLAPVQANDYMTASKGFTVSITYNNVTKLSVIYSVFEYCELAAEMDDLSMSNLGVSMIYYYDAVTRYYNVVNK